MRLPHLRTARRGFAHSVVAALVCVAWNGVAQGQSSDPLPGPTPAIVTATMYRDVQRAEFVGALGCSSTLCHGGGPAPITNQTVVVDGDQKRNAYSIWKARDAHAKSWATLATERSARMAQSMGLGKAQDTTRCTECHAPMAALAPARLSSLVRAEEGISCENCHGPSQAWIRSHTRLDLNHGQRVGLGMRDLDSLYNRANNCVSCHQVLAPDLQKAGHPPLVFELDAQSVAQPKHWIDKGEFAGPQAWMVGQATALREMSWALNKRSESADYEREQWRGLLWTMQKVVGVLSEFPKYENLTGVELSPGNLIRVQEVSDSIAKDASRRAWDAGMTRRFMDGLCALEGDFRSSGESSAALQQRALRVTLGLSRALAAFQARDKERWSKAADAMGQLFMANDARGEFNKVTFADKLAAFRNSLAYAGSDEPAAADAPKKEKKAKKKKKEKEEPKKEEPAKTAMN